MKNRNEVLELSIEFAISVISFAELLEKNRKFVIANQLLKAGTSIGANIHEAQSAESKADFIHKLKIADKEANETEYWLILCEKADSYPYDPNIMTALISIKKLLSKIISSSKRNQQINKSTN